MVVFIVGLIVCVVLGGFWLNLRGLGLKFLVLRRTWFVLCVDFKGVYFQILKSEVCFEIDYSQV